MQKKSDLFKELPAFAFELFEFELFELPAFELFELPAFELDPSAWEWEPNPDFNLDAALAWEWEPNLDLAPPDFNIDLGVDFDLDAAFKTFCDTPFFWEKKP
ncbi:MAG: hypothetical protein WAQ53_15440 [Thiofilum sp.]|uniref:hypothetical protein n=1 Tax=Thiofilum sp. TaxID=2212733 RepID=UPI0025CEE5E2|nr:hypothetical protein [Thiofilum sp.]MBK8451757.1 hypothetical protein [Thiofilum sp.]